jgi:hypothetical protein
MLQGTMQQVYAQFVVFVNIAGGMNIKKSPEPGHRK